MNRLLTFFIFSLCSTFVTAELASNVNILTLHCNQSVGLYYRLLQLDASSNLLVRGQPQASVDLSEQGKKDWYLDPEFQCRQHGLDRNAFQSVCSNLFPESHGFPLDKSFFFQSDQLLGEWPPRDQLELVMCLEASAPKTKSAEQQLEKDANPLSFVPPDLGQSGDKNEAVKDLLEQAQQHFHAVWSVDDLKWIKNETVTHDSLVRQFVKADQLGQQVLADLLQSHVADFNDEAGYNRISERYILQVQKAVTIYLSNLNDTIAEELRHASTIEQHLPWLIVDAIRGVHVVDNNWLLDRLGVRLTDLHSLHDNIVEAVQNATWVINRLKTNHLSTLSRRNPSVSPQYSLPTERSRPPYFPFMFYALLLFTGIMILILVSIYVHRRLTKVQRPRSTVSSSSRNRYLIRSHRGEFSSGDFQGTKGVHINNRSRNIDE